MPVWLARYLPHLLVVGAVIGAIWFIDHRGYQRAQKDAQFERLVTARLIDRRIAQLENEPAQQLHELDGALVAELGNIETVRRTVVQPAIEEAIRNDPSLGDPDRAVDRSVLDALNTAIEQSACPGRAAGDDC